MLTELLNKKIETFLITLYTFEEKINFAKVLKTLIHDLEHVTMPI